MHYEWHQKQQNVPVGYVINIVVAFMDCNVPFFKGNFQADGLRH